MDIKYYYAGANFHYEKKYGQNYTATATYYAGKAVGDIGSMIIGGMQLTIGTGIALGGMAINATGVGSLIGVPAILIGTAIASHGITVGTTAALNVGENAKNTITYAKTTKEAGSSNKLKGKVFDPKGKVVQEGVDPNTLNPGKNLNTLDPIRQKNAVKYAGDKPIIVDRKGNVLDGHHRLKDAIENSRAVDIQIGY